MAIIEYQVTTPLPELIKQYPLVILDFWAVWCAPCRAMLPSLETLAARHQELTVIKINADQHPLLLADYQVRGLPTMVLIEKGVIVERTSATFTLNQFREWLSPYLADPIEKLLFAAQQAQADERLQLLRQASEMGAHHLEANEQLFSELFLSRADSTIKQEIQQRLQKLNHDILRSPIISRIQSVMKFAEDYSQQSELLKPAYLAAMQEEYEQALELLFEINEEQLDSEVKALIVRILDLMPDRRLAHQYRRRLT